MSAVEAASPGGSGHDPAAPGGQITQPMSPSAAQTEVALAQAQDLKAWWAEVEAGKAPVERFQLFPAYPGMAPTWGFFGEAPVQGQTVPVMGDVGDYFFDRPRVPESGQTRAAAWMAEQVEEFALHYWLRVQAWALPLPYPELGHVPPPPYLRSLSWCNPAELPELSGTGSVQRYYKLRADGRIGEFPPGDRRTIVDLRELGTIYEWITLDSRLFDFDMTLSVGGDDLLSLVVPTGTTVHAVLNADLIVNQRQPRPGTRGAFGVGFGLMRDPPGGVIAFGPDKVQPGLGLEVLRVLDSGEVRLRAVMIMARPEKLLNLSLDPLDWGLQAADLLTLGAARRFTEPIAEALGQLPMRGIGFDPLFGSIRLLNLATGDRAASELCISKEHFEREILAKDAVTRRQALLGTRKTWLQIPNWLDRSAIPEWVARGETVDPSEGESV